VQSVTSYVGTGSPRFYLPLDQIFPQSNVSQLVVLPVDTAARERLRMKIIEVFKTDFPEVRGRVKLLPNGPPVPYPVQFQVLGPDIGVVRTIADQVKEVMAANPNTLGVNDNWNESVKVLRLDLDQDKLRALGVTSQSVRQVVQTTLTGTPIGQFRESNMVQSDVVEGIQGPTVTDQVNAKLAEIRAKLPAGYRVVVEGAAADSSEAEASIMANVPLVLFITFTLLMLQLHSFSRSLLVFLTGPLGVAGAAMALLILDRPFGFVANLGVIALFGMIIRNSVILVDQIEHDIANGSHPWDAIVESAVRRCRPILLTAAAAALAMIPLSRSTFWGPMAVAIMGGLIVATALTLLFLPALYAAWFRVKKPEQGDASLNR